MKTPSRSKLLLAPLTAALVMAGALFMSPSPSLAAPASEELVEMEVRDVVPLEEADTHAVVLISKDHETMLPIFVNEVAAVAIALRLAHRQPPYPLAHDLLDNVVSELGGTVTEVRIDKVEGEIYHGRVFITQGKRKLELSASPSESIAMALTRKARIFATRKVLSQAGITREEIERLHRQGKLGPEPDQPALPKKEPHGNDVSL